MIYAEWGRNFFTFERFHGCIDAQFSGTPPPTVTANIALNPNVTTFTGSGSIQLNGSASVGSNLTYAWSVDSENPGLYSITNPTSPLATLNLIAFLEEEYGIEIEAHETDVDNFDRLNDIAAFVERKRALRPAGTV